MIIIPFETAWSNRGRIGCCVGCVLAKARESKLFIVFPLVRQHGSGSESNDLECCRSTLVPRRAAKLRSFGLSRSTWEPWLDDLQAASFPDEEFGDEAASHLGRMEASLLVHRHSDGALASIWTGLERG